MTGENPWVKKLTSMRSGAESSPAPSTKRKSKRTGKLAGLKAASSSPSTVTLANIGSAAQPKRSISPTPSTTVTLPDTSIAGTKQTLQPFGGPGESSPVQMNVKRARIFKTAFPPHTPVRVEWDYDPSPSGVTPGQTGHSVIAGKVGSYSAQGWVQIVNLNGNPDGKFLAPCARITLHHRDPIAAWGE